MRGRETYLRPYKMNPRAVLSAVYAWKCKTPAVLHFSKLIFNGRLCELYSPVSGPHMLPLRTPDLEQLRFYGANEITFPFKIWWAFPIMKPTQSQEFERQCLLEYAPRWFLIRCLLYIINSLKPDTFEKMLLFDTIYPIYIRFLYKIL